LHLNYLNFVGLRYRVFRPDVLTLVNGRDLKSGVFMSGREQCPPITTDVNPTPDMLKFHLCFQV